MWNKTNHDFGTQTYSTTKELLTVFTYDGDDTITKFKGSCDCLDIILKDNSLVVRWNIPQPTFNGYESRKYIVVQLSNGDIDELKLNAHIIP